MLTKKQVLHVAELAKLHLTKKEVVKFQKELFDILEYIKILNELDTSNVKPTSQVTGLENIFREDELYARFTCWILLHARNDG